MSRLDKRIMIALLRDEISYEQAQKGFKDPEAMKLSTVGVPDSYRTWGRIKTARMSIAFCWYVHRNALGYFVGWRQVWDTNGGFTRDQFVARRVKKRLVEMQLRRTNAHLEKGAQKMRWRG